MILVGLRHKTIKQGDVMSLHPTAILRLPGAQTLGSFFFFFFFFLSFFLSSFLPSFLPSFLSLPHLQHMEVPGLGVKSQLRLLAYATATATWDPSHCLRPTPQLMAMPDP